MHVTHVFLNCVAFKTGLHQKPCPSCCRVAVGVYLGLSMVLVLVFRINFYISKILFAIPTNIKVPSKGYGIIM